MASNQDVLKGRKTDFISILSRDFLIFDMVHQKNILTERDYQHLVDLFDNDKERAARTLIDKVRYKGDQKSTMFVNLLQEELILDTYPRLKEIFNLNANLNKNGTQDVGMIEDSSYTMTSDPRGLCVVINNENFKNHKQRKGTQNDVDALVKVFSWLGFRVVLCQDQTKIQMADVLRHFASLNLAELQKCKVKEWSGSQFTEIKNPIMHGDALICCALSHGERGGICGIDDTVLSIDEMSSTFIGSKCPALSGKPKVFILQACQGSKVQSGVQVDSAEKEEEMETDTVPGSTSQQPYYIPEEADFLKAFSTVETYVSFRDGVEGSWFIQSLCKQLEIGCTRGDDILTIFTRVNNEVSLKEAAKAEPGKKKQMSELKSTLRKTLIFHRKK
ncbi:caspase-8-like [Osmerus eperlanus]|uniref:caspase-8-like n=1 Tax=Osmerus eperlanus TaxID=29151 RepID=UPI002E1468DD